jgi:sugar phosphate permease
MYFWNDIPKRWQLILLLQSGFIIEYALRVNASVAVVKMKEEFQWTEDQHGIMLSSFYWGYAAGQLPSIFIVHRFGAKYVFAGSIFLAAIMTIILPMAAEVSYFAALVLRALTGLAESAAFPATYHMYPKWVPADEQTSMITVVMSGLYLGEIICFLLSGYLVVSQINISGVDIGGWIAVFWVFGVLGIMWTPLWLLSVHETPQEHPSITDDELLMLTGNNH